MLKPLPSFLLTFIGVCAAIIANQGHLTPKLLLIMMAVLSATAGANGLTNYLDRDVDARMKRTRNRALPSKRIYPPQKVLPPVIGLIIIGLALSWRLHPYVLLVDLVGTTVAATWRKKVTCVYPQGVIASCAPILMGWLAIKASLNWEILILCVMIAAWLPLHVWSLIISNREDYLQAGLSYFPINLEVKHSVKVLFAFSILLYAASIALYAAGGFSWLYLATANLLGILMVFASSRMVITSAARDALRLYRVSSFPYLGLVFLVMCLDIWFIG